MQTSKVADSALSANSGLYGLYQFTFSIMISAASEQNHQSIALRSALSTLRLLFSDPQISGCRCKLL